MARKYEPEVDSIRVSREEIEAAYDEVDERLVEAVVEAEARITRFHERQKERDLWLEEVEPGLTLGVKTTPIDRAGLYVPGRRAAYPSTALMNAIPAKVAGVASLCACSPPPILPLTLVALRHRGRLGGLPDRRGAGDRRDGPRDGEHPAVPEDRRAGERVRDGREDAPP